MATLFVTGATGSIGSQILPQLTQKHTVRALVRNAYPNPIKGVEWVAGDIRRPESYIAAMKGCDVLIHLAADVSNDSNELKIINVLATHQLVLAARQQGIKKIIVFSSASVSKKYFTPYSESKKEMETMLRELHIPLIILRPTLVYYKNSRYVHGMERYIHLPFPFFPLPDGDLADLRPIHVRDVGNSLLAILLHPFPDRFTVYDLASEESFTFEDAIRAIAAKKRVNKPIVNFPHAWFGQIYNLLGCPSRKPWSMFGQLGAAGESYVVDPKPFMEKYHVKFSNPQIEFAKCIE